MCHNDKTVLNKLALRFEGYPDDMPVIGSRNRIEWDGTLKSELGFDILYKYNWDIHDDLHSVSFKMNIMGSCLVWTGELHNELGITQLSVTSEADPHQPEIYVDLIELSFDHAMFDGYYVNRVEAELIDIFDSEFKENSKHHEYEMSMDLAFETFRQEN